jgi:hypothetical protein
MGVDDLKAAKNMVMTALQVWYPSLLKYLPKRRIVEERL